MSLFARGLLTIFGLMGLGLVFIFLMIYQSPWFAVPLFGIAFGGHLITDKLTCPQCGNPVLNPPPGRLWPKNIFRTTCAKCGHDLTASP
jgi:hypothetical protein